MKERSADVIIVGGGPAGLAAASSCKEAGIDKVLLVEKEGFLGGILPQCIHEGFGLDEVKDNLTGPEFAERLEKRVHDLGVEVLSDTFAEELFHEGQGEVAIHCVSPRGVEVLKATCLIYSAGCRERTVYEAGIVGDRPSGVLTAGTAQTLMDMQGFLPGREVVVVGSGDVGLIMSRRLAIEGALVKAVVEILPHPGGLMRNVVRCLEDFGIPLLLSHAVLEMRGKTRINSVVVSEVNEEYTPVEGTEKEISCDTVVVAAGLIPEVNLLEKAGAELDPATGGPVVNEYLETSLRGVYACGNVLVVNDLVDHAVEQGRLCAGSVKSSLEGSLEEHSTWKRTLPGENLRFVVPQLFSGERDTIFYMRVKRPLKNCRLSFTGLTREVRLPVVRPAEMVRVSLEAQLISGAGDQLTFKVIR